MFFRSISKRCRGNTPGIHLFTKRVDIFFSVGRCRWFFKRYYNHLQNAKVCVKICSVKLKYLLTQERATTCHHGQAKKYAALSTSGNRGSNVLWRASLMGKVIVAILSRRCFPVVRGSEPYINLIFRARHHGQAVKTPPSHGGNRGSIPRGGAKTKKG